MKELAKDRRIREAVASNREMLRHTVGWLFDQWKVDVGLVECVEIGTKGSRLMLCHRPCQEYAHFHAVKDVNPECTCFPVEEPWTYYGIVEPGGALEPNPDCQMHFPPKAGWTWAR